LAARAKKNRSEPLPFYLDLSYWDGKKPGFEQWCISAISKEYGPRESDVSVWLEEDDLVLIFDGLDQLPRKLRTESFAAINRLRQNHGLLGIVVTSREQEYSDTSKRLQLNGCLWVNSLTAASVVEALLSAGDEHRGLLKATQSNRKLADLLRTPLFLVLALEAYNGAPEEKISKNASPWSATVIEAYLHHAEGRIATTNRTSDLGLRSWLPILAARLNRNHEPTFYPDRLPISYLSSGPKSLRDAATRRAGMLNAVLFGTVVALVRLPYLGVMFGDSFFIAYAGISIIFVVAVMIAVYHYARRAIRNPVNGRLSRPRGLWLRLIVNWTVGYVSLGSLASALNNMHASGAFVYLIWIGDIIVGMYPGWVLSRRLTLDEEKVPRYPGEENRSLLVTSVSCAITAAVALYISLFATFEPISLGAPKTFPMPAPILLMYFVVPYAAIIGLRNGGSDFIARYAACQIVASRHLLPRPYLRSFDSLRATSILVPRQGGYGFIHSLVRDYISSSAVRLPEFEDTTTMLRTPLIR